MAGRASEELFFESVSTGAANDIEKATQLARSMVTRFGMSKEIGLMGVETIQDEYLMARAVMNCSDQTSAIVDQVVKKMLDEAYGKAKNLLDANRAAMDKIAAYLFEKETITGKEFMQLLKEVQEAEEPKALPEDQSQSTEETVQVKE